MIGGAIRSDLILSSEIIVISLGSMCGRTLMEQFLTLAAISVVMTIGVYGLVAGIVKLDDAGLALNRDRSDHGWARFKRSLGNGLLRSTPYLMKFLSVAGTLAMFLVGGNILIHGFPFLHHFVEPYTRAPIGGGLLSMLFSAAVGLVAGCLLVAAVTLVARLRKGAQPA